MNDDDHIEAFCELFQGRTDAYGTWEGGKTPNLTDEPTWPLVEHLTTGPYIGVYCTTDDNHTRWGCIDIDGKDFQHNWDEMWGTANLLCDALEHVEVKGWTERTTNGIHVWVFAEQPVPAAVMRRALLVTCQVIDYQPKEVNPKQETLNPDKPFGNYVRLPYYGYFLNGMPEDRFIMDEDGPLTLEQFQQAAQAHLAPLTVLESMAELYVPPTAKEIDVDLDAITDIDFLVPILPPVVRAIYEDGPLNGDRSHAIVKSAVIMRDEGWQAQGIYQVIDAIDRRLGKFTDRDAAERATALMEIVEKYGTR